MGFSRRVRFGDGRIGLPRVEFARAFISSVAPPSPAHPAEPRAAGVGGHSDPAPAHAPVRPASVADGSPQHPAGTPVEHARDEQGAGGRAGEQEPARPPAAATAVGGGRRAGAIAPRGAHAGL